jgi:murein DD-endopeptidase MepM/ murein hydrolase activator NlpD
MKIRFILSSPYGDVSSVHPTPHTGMDLAMPEGTLLRTVKDGVVDKVFNGGKCGNGVLVQFDTDKYNIYCHMKEVFVSPGQRLQYGDKIGLSGNTGYSTGPHLHFGVKEGGQYLDPSSFNNDLQELTGNMTFEQDHMQGTILDSVFDVIESLVSDLG